MNDFLPILENGPVVICYDVQDTPKLRAAIKALFQKYPNITLACVDYACYISFQDIAKVHVMRYPYMAEYGREKYNVIGILCGSDRVFADDGLKVMRV